MIKAMLVEDSWRNPEAILEGKPWRRIMKGKSWRRGILKGEPQKRNPKRGIPEEKAWKRNPRKGFFKERYWGRNHGGGILQEEDPAGESQEESPQRNRPGVIPKEESSRWNPGG